MGSSNLPARTGSLSLIGSPNTSALPARLERSARREILFEEARARQAIRSLENISLDAQESATEVVRSAVNLAQVCPAAEGALRDLANESVTAMARIVRESGRAVR